MKTELKGAWRSGFRLTEKDLRRIIDLVVEKIKTNVEQTVTKKITYKLANGAIINSENVDDIFAEENSGTKRIISVQCEMTAAAGIAAEIRFHDLVVEKEEKNSIFLQVAGRAARSVICAFFRVR